MRLANEKNDSFIKALVLFTTGILAHILAGGDVVNPGRFLFLISLIAISLFLTRGQNLEGPQLALLVVMLQSSGHFILGMADKSTDLQMITAHIIAGVISYHTVRHFDGFHDFFAKFIDSLQIPNFKVLEILIQEAPHVVADQLVFIQSTTTESNLVRGPPLEKKR